MPFLFKVCDRISKQKKNLEGDNVVKLWVVLLPDCIGAGGLRLPVGAQGHLVGCLLSRSA